ncbi:hypothetical protein KA005_12690 [bacterium]|nr:hypothetical protein [bacterium]
MTEKAGYETILLRRKKMEKLTTVEMTALYEVDSFCAPFVFVKRKADGVKGSMEFDHMPRFYYNFIPNEIR